MPLFKDFRKAIGNIYTQVLELGHPKGQSLDVMPFSVIKLLPLPMCRPLLPTVCFTTLGFLGWFDKL